MVTKRLSMRQTREILRQKFVLGRSHREIAQSLGISVGAVGMAVARARVAGLDWPQVETLADDVLDARFYRREALPTGERPVPDCVYLHTELHSRVEEWRGGQRRLRLHPPPPRTGRGELPHPALLLTAHFTPRLIGLIALGALSAWPRVPNAVVVVQPQPPIQPLPTPPLPAETCPLSRSFQMTPHFLLDPVANRREISAGVSDPKIRHPAREDQIHLADDALHGV